MDIGGGFGLGYLADGEQWERCTTALTDAVLGTRPPLTWGGYGYGLRNEATTLRRTLGGRSGSTLRTGRAISTSCSRTPPRGSATARWPSCYWSTYTTCMSNPDAACWTSAD